MRKHARTVGISIAAALCTPTCTIGGPPDVSRAFEAQPTMSRFYDASKGDSNLDRMHQVDQVCGGDSAPIPPRAAADIDPGLRACRPRPSPSMHLGESRDELDLPVVAQGCSPSNTLVRSSSRSESISDPISSKSGSPSPVSGRGHSEDAD